MQYLRVSKKVKMRPTMKMSTEELGRLLSAQCPEPPPTLRNLAVAEELAAKMCADVL